jgi:hypothetical protein
VPEKGRHGELGVQGCFLVEVIVKKPLCRGIVLQRHGAGQGVLSASTSVLRNATEFGICNIICAFPDGLDCVEWRKELFGIFSGASVVEAERKNCLSMQWSEQFSR